MASKLLTTTTTVWIIHTVFHSMSRGSKKYLKVRLGGYVSAGLHEETLAPPSGGVKSIYRVHIHMCV
jgi:hypothetical protein